MKAVSRLTDRKLFLAGAPSFFRIECGTCHAQRRYWEHTIRDDHDYAAHMGYIHFNPVKHGLADTPAD